MKHLTTEELSRHLDGEPGGRPGEELERHLAACGACRAALAELAATDRGLKRALDHDPGDAYFESFAARVGDRIRAAGLSGAQARRDSWFAWLRSPRGLTWAGVVATVAAGAAIALLNADRTPALRDRIMADGSLGTRSTAEATAPADRETNEPAPAPDAAVFESKSPAPPSDEKERALAKAAQEQDEGGAALERRENTAQSSPARAREVRRDASGELVPVPEPGFASPPPAPAEPARPVSGGVRVRKKSSAQPLVGAVRGQANEENQHLTPTPVRSSERLMATTSDIRLCGQIVDPSGRPVAGAQVVLPQAGRNVASDSSGRFCLWAPAGDHELTVMAVGFEASRQQVHVGGEAAEARVTVNPVSVLGDGSLAFRGGRAGETSITVRGVPTEAPDSPPAALSPPAGADRDLRMGIAGPDPFATLSAGPRTLAREAERQTARAKDHPSAAAFDRAAGAWEKVIVRLPAGPADLSARANLAEARYRTWLASPTPARARVAAEALEAYLSRAPAGVAREQATRWLEQVRK